MKIAQIQMHVSGDKTADLRHAAEAYPRGGGDRPRGAAGDVLLPV